MTKRRERMVAGLGTDSTPVQLVRRIAKRLRQRMLTDTLVVSTSTVIEQEARRCNRGIPLPANLLQAQRDYFGCPHL